MEKIYDIVEELKSNSSILKKLEILEKNKSNEMLKEFFFMALNDSKYGIKKIDVPAPATVSTVSFEEVVNHFSLLKERKITGNKALFATSDLLARLTQKEQTVFLQILQKKPRCNVSTALVNRIWEKLIPLEIKLAKAVAYSESAIDHIKYPAFSQRKCDGARALAFKSGNEVHIFTSGNKEYMGLSKLCEEIATLSDKDFVLDGEMLVVDKNEKVLSRKEGNGILNKSVHNTISDKEAEQVRMCCWEYIPMEEYSNGLAKNTYEDNFTLLTMLILNADVTRVDLVETKIVSSKEEALEHFREMISRGEEGTILKNKNQKWNGKRVKDNVKMKIVMQSTMEIVSVFEGNEKYVGMTGGFICKSSDGMVEVRVGSGLSDDDRKISWENKDAIIGKMIEIESNGIIQAQDGTYSLFLPRFIEFREDKSVADDYETIKALSNGSEMLKK